MIIKQGIKWLWLGILLLAACSPASGGLTEGSTSGGETLQTGAVTMPPALTVEAETTEASAQSLPEGVTTEQPRVQTEAPASPTMEANPIATEFQPTDPSSVQLGDGKPKLVEFFAFW